MDQLGANERGQKKMNTGHPKEPLFPQENEKLEDLNFQENDNYLYDLIDASKQEQAASQEKQTAQGVQIPFGDEVEIVSQETITPSVAERDSASKEVKAPSLNNDTDRRNWHYARFFPKKKAIDVDDDRVAPSEKLYFFQIFIYGMFFVLHTSKALIAMSPWLLVKSLFFPLFLVWTCVFGMFYISRFFLSRQAMPRNEARSVFAYVIFFSFIIYAFVALTFGQTYSYIFTLNTPHLLETLLLLTLSTVCALRFGSNLEWKSILTIVAPFVLYFTLVSNLGISFVQTLISRI